MRERVRDRFDQPWNHDPTGGFPGAVRFAAGMLVALGLAVPLLNALGVA